jgi:hypothetical protein
MRAAYWLAAFALTGCSAELGREVDRMPDDPEPLPSPDGPEAPAVPERTGAPAPLRLLTRAEYANTVEDLLGPERVSAVGAVALIPAENEALGLDNIADAHLASAAHVDGYRAAAVRLAAAAVEGGLVDCDSDATDACGQRFIRTFGRRVFRRPLTEAEFRVFDDLRLRVTTRAGFDVAMEAVVQAFLQSPQFLYRVEFDGTWTGDTVRLDGHVLASRLSYLLWASAPDEALLDAAEAGRLDTADGIETEARRLLADPRAHRGAENFYRQLLGSQGFDTMNKDPDAYPGFEPALALDLRRSLHSFMDHVIFEAGADALFASDQIWTTPRLSELYGLPQPAEPFGPVRADPNRRRGLLTQPALMALLGKPDGSAPILRGVFVLERMFCRTPPPPPPDAPTVAPDPDPNATTRERFAQHTEDEACRSCHQYIDPVGFAFEHYDGIGRWRDFERDQPIDASGAITLTRDPSLAGPVQDGVDLSARLVEAREIRDCIATQWFRYGMGRAEVMTDRGALERMGQVLQDTGSFREMLVAMVRSEPFRSRRWTEEDSAR